MSQAAEDRIRELNAQFKSITGEDAFLYASKPDTRTLYTFVTNARPFSNVGDALAHMQTVLEKAQNGWSVDEILYGKTSYPNAHAVNRGAW